MIFGGRFAPKSVANISILSMAPMIELISFLALFLAAMPALLFTFNLALFERPRKDQTRRAISVLIPARNEERAIADTIQAVLASTGVDLELLVLDDRSEDRTRDIVTQLAARDRRVHVETAPPLPEGWCGKQHACSILAGLARKPLLCFLDADVRLQPEALSASAHFLTESTAGLVSGFPRQTTSTFLEQLLVPLIHFVLLGFLPIWRMRRTLSPRFGAGCGQLMLTTAQVYRQTGGHAMIRQTLHDGISLPRAFRRSGVKTDIFDASGLASCRMYRSNREVWQGLLKNATEGLGSPALIGPASILLLCGQVLPFLLFFLILFKHGGSVAMVCSVAAIALSYLPRSFSAWRFGDSFLSTALHPLGVSLLVLIQWWALLRHLAGAPSVWKGRHYPLGAQKLRRTIVNWARKN
jgi:Glycosyl transferase family 2